LLQVDYDDANVPSLLSIPLLGYRHDTAIYNATRERILSSRNPFVSAGGRAVRQAGGRAGGQRGWWWCTPLVAPGPRFTILAWSAAQLFAILNIIPPGCMHLPRPPLHSAQFFEGKHFKGIGSPHTPPQMVWPLAISVQGLTAPGAEERAEMLRTMLKMQCGNGLMHESGGWRGGG
jgi:meiotically up-regulated gene 157 (Mug157) protein